jgi:hypothetical protein
MTYSDALYEIKWREFPMVIGRGRRREHAKPAFCTTTKTKRGKNRAYAEDTSGQSLFQ